MLSSAADAQAQARERESAAIAPRVTPLSPGDRERLAACRATVETRVDAETRRRYATASGKLAAVRSLVKARVFQPSQTRELECLGVVLGDAMAQGLKLEWVTAEARSGYHGPALRQIGFDLVVFPVAMIASRAARGEPVDVDALYEGVAAQARAAR